MARFIKVTTGKSTPVWISTARIAFIDTYCREPFPNWRASIGFSAQEGDYIPVCETPEQILTLIATQSKDPSQ